MKLRILFTGGTGLLALNWALSVRDRHTVILGLHEREITLAGVKSVKIDLEVISHLVNAIELEKPDVVIHTAGLTSVEKCETSPELAHHINVQLAVNVAQACAKLEVPLVHISTDHLFDGTVSMVDEICSVGPVNVYGRTKAEAETRVMKAHPKALVIRTNFYGWGTSYRQSFSDEVIEALRAGKELTLFEDVLYTPILAESAAQAVHDLLGLKASGIFNVVGDERISKYEFGIKLAQKFMLNANLIKPGSISDRASLVRRPRDMSLSNQKISTLLGRRLGGVAKHIARLYEQEQSGLAQELKAL